MDQPTPVHEALNTGAPADGHSHLDKKAEAIRNSAYLGLECLEELLGQITTWLSAHNDAVFGGPKGRPVNLMADRSRGAGRPESFSAKGIVRQRKPSLASVDLRSVWALDVMLDTLYDGRPFRTLIVLDEGNRKALRIECGISIPPARVGRALNHLLEFHGKPTAIRLDHGLGSTAEVVGDWAAKHRVRLLLTETSNSTQKGFVERFNRSFRRAVLAARLFSAVSEVQSAADDWLRLQRVPPARLGAGCEGSEK